MISELKDLAIAACETAITRYERLLSQSTLRGDPAIAQRAIVTQQIADYRRRLNALQNAA